MYTGGHTLSLHVALPICLVSFRSTLLAHDAQVMPPISSSIAASGWDAGAVTIDAPREWLALAGRRTAVVVQWRWLVTTVGVGGRRRVRGGLSCRWRRGLRPGGLQDELGGVDLAVHLKIEIQQIGRASCRQRVCPSG